MSDEKGKTPQNDNSSPAYDKAKSNYNQGKPAEQTRLDLGNLHRGTPVKPVDPANPKK